MRLGENELFIIPRLLVVNSLKSHVVITENFTYEVKVGLLCLRCSLNCGLGLDNFGCYFGNPVRTHLRFFRVVNPVARENFVSRIGLAD